ncbi:uncharacterized protein DUF4276 [Arcicella aurantiaca]|uniref:Uncharacterized protein DUF4276 n=2 Tax=Arcicella aurantiaca TaxID=591202 RepID=A0A316DZ08_9BACT|nr:uncharacterized protein DUF4276 [Arcicella aurantiaca]
MRIEFLLEESSMENLLKIILPKILPEGFELDINCFLRPHSGKSDLHKSIPKKIRAFSNFNEKVKIIIVQDQDSNDCKLLKKKIVELCSENGDCPVLVRIACRELEAWYLGDMDAIEKVYPKFKAKSHRNLAKFRNPDICNPYNELVKIIKDFQKGKASREIPEYMNIDNNTSESFNQFVKGVVKFLEFSA